MMPFSPEGDFSHCRPKNLAKFAKVFDHHVSELRDELAARRSFQYGADFNRKFRVILERPFQIGSWDKAWD